MGTVIMRNCSDLDLFIVNSTTMLAINQSAPPELVGSLGTVLPGDDNFLDQLLPLRQHRQSWQKPAVTQHALKHDSYVPVPYLLYLTGSRNNEIITTLVQRIQTILMQSQIKLWFFSSSATNLMRVTYFNTRVYFLPISSKISTLTQVGT